MKFNENLKYLRKKDELTQEELAERLNVSKQSIEEWEKGETLPSIQKAKELAHILAVSVDTLIGDITYKKKNNNKKLKGDSVMKFNENLKYLRKREGITQEELAERLNVSRQSVTKWESGQSLPDIEKVKEIAYMFSVSVDSLVGDIECKSVNKIKKKIDDIGWLIFGLVFFIGKIILEIYYFLSRTIENEDLTIGIMVGIVLVTFIIFIAKIKAYLKNNKEIILNMKNTKEARKERIRYLVKKYLISLVYWFILTPILHLGTLAESVNLFIIECIKFAAFGLVFDLIFAIGEYLNLEKRVKALENE